MEIKIQNGSENNTNPPFAERIKSLKEEMDKTTKKSKENISFIIASCTTSYGKAIETHKQYVKELREQLNHQNLDNSLVDEIAHEFFCSLNLLEDVIDTIVDSYILRSSNITKYYSRQFETLSNTHESNPMNNENVLNLFQKTFEQSIEHSTQDMKNIVDMYNDYLALTTNFNKCFFDTLSNSPMIRIKNLQSKEKQMAI